MGLLMMLATIGGLGLAFILLVLAWWNNLNWLRNFVFGAAAIWFGVYGITLFAVSLASQNNFLRFDEPMFEEKFSPFEAFEKEIAFDLPANSPRLDIREGYTIDYLLEAFLIGDEDSVWHGRNYFQLEEQTPRDSVKQN